MLTAARLLQYAVLCLGLLSLGCTSLPISNVENPDQPHLVLVSFDGFRSDYAERWQLPAFLAMAEDGSRSRGLIPSYPSKTFPNHYSIVTGLYPGNHGLIDNNFLDPVRQLPYRMNNRSAVEDPQFYGGKPLWQHVQDHGKRSAAYFWVGSEAPIGGRYPDYYRLYDGGVANDARIDQVIEWMRLPQAQRPVFVSLYFSLVDSAAHTYGPLANTTRQAAVEADRLLGKLASALQALPIRSNIVVVSDHGMVPVVDTASSYIHIPQLSELEKDATVVYNQTQVLIYLRDPATGPVLKAQLQ
ncbi:MAG TPA: alkaline phosphatase family protein, partial [Pseudomonadaceae bacterium]|nr:alkaline phosphatase family protein [Pseudomonadaceae bacterium]